MPVVMDAKPDNADDISGLPKKGQVLDFVTLVTGVPKDAEKSMIVEIYTDHGPVYGYTSASSPTPEKKSNDHAKSLAERIQAKATFQVVFNKLAKDIPSPNPHYPLVKRGAVFFGFYRPDDEAWEVWSNSHPTKPNYHFIWSVSGQGGQKLHAPVHPLNNEINIWGETFKFDEQGNVSYPPRGPDVCGDLRIFKD